MEVVTCPACKGTGERGLPTRDGLEPWPCPCCKPDWWPHGFPGESVMRRGRIIYIIKPSNPGEPAEYIGLPATN